MGLKRLWFCLVSAAAFFVTYDCTKSLLGAGGPLAAPHVAPVAHMLAASLGEIVSFSAPTFSRFISFLFNLRSPTLLLHPFIHSMNVRCFRLSDITGLRAQSSSWGGFLETLQVSLLPVLICLLFQLRPPDSSYGVAL